MRQIFLQQDNGKQYLYLQQNVHFTVVDVTDPKNPKIVDRIAAESKLEDVGSGLAIAIKSDTPGQDSVPHADGKAPGFDRSEESPHGEVI